MAGMNPGPAAGYGANGYATGSAASSGNAMFTRNVPAHQGNVVANVTTHLDLQKLRAILKAQGQERRGRPAGQAARRFYNTDNAPGSFDVVRQEIAFITDTERNSLGATAHVVIPYHDMRVETSLNDLEIDPDNLPRAVGVMDTEGNMTRSSPHQPKRFMASLCVRGTRFIVNQSKKVFFPMDPVHVNFLRPAGVEPLDPVNGKWKPWWGVNNGPKTKLVPSIEPLTFGEYGTCSVFNSLWRGIEARDVRQNRPNNRNPNAGYHATRFDPHINVLRAMVRNAGTLDNEVLAEMEAHTEFDINELSTIKRDISVGTRATGTRHSMDGMLAKLGFPAPTPQQRIVFAYHLNLFRDMTLHYQKFASQTVGVCLSAALPGEYMDIYVSPPS